MGRRLRSPTCASTDAKVGYENRLPALDNARGAAAQPPARLRCGCYVRPMTRIAAIAPVLPPHSSSQAEITAAIAPLLAPDPKRRPLVERMYASSTAERRYSALPLEAYQHLG